MRRSLLVRRAVTCAAALLLCSANGTTQVRVLPVGPVPGDKTDQTRTDNGQFTIPEQRDAREQLKAVIDYLGRTNIPWDVVTGTTQRLLDAKSDSFYRVKDAKGNDTGAVVSVKAKVNQLLAEFPKEGRQFYEQEFGPPATELLKKAVEGGYDKAALGEVSQRYYHTRAGAQATLLLANLDLEGGQYVEAAYGFQRLMARPESAEILSPRVLLKASVAFRRSSDPRHGEVVSKLWDRLEKGFPRDGLVLGRKAYTLAELKAELDRAIDLGAGRATELAITARLGNASHTGVGEGGTPFLVPSFTGPLLEYRTGDAKEGAEWVGQSLEAAFKRADPSKKEVTIPGFFPVTTAGMVVHRGYDGVYARCSQDGLVWQGKARALGDILWFTNAEGGAQSLMSEDHAEPQRWWSAYWGARSPGVLFENAAVGSLSHDGKLVYFVDDVAIPPPPVLPNMNGIPQPPAAVGMNSGTRRAMMQNYSRLTAVSLETGKLVWSLGGLEAVPLKDEEEDKTTNTQLLTEGSYFLGPPLMVNGKLYVLYERKNQVKLACLDPNRVVLTPPAPGSTTVYRYPELIWTQSLGDSATSLRNDTLRRVQPAYLAYADGVLICPTNCGVVVAVDVNSRSLLWARYYGSAPDPKNQLGTGGAVGGFPGGVIIGRNGMPQPQPPLANDRWRASAPIITGGKVVLAAHDSDLLQCLDLRSGEALWASPREQDDLYVGGVTRDKVLVVGKKSVRAYVLGGNGEGGKKLAWDKIRIGTPCGHGAMGKDGVYYLPVVGSADAADGKEPQVCGIDVAEGKVKSSTPYHRKFDAGADVRQVLGNLHFQDGLLFSQSAHELTAFPLIENIRREMTERLKANPNDPAGLFARGELSLDNGDIREAIADFQGVAKNAPSEQLQKKLRQKLYDAYTKLLRDKFEDGERYLAEYETLCEVSLDTDDPSERQRRLDEQLRRRGLYLTVVAKGRERQGRLMEAFDAYRAFASLGDNKQLVAIADEPNGVTRPDVWARGRIDSMIRGAKDAEARKPLEDRVRKEWESLRTANDLPRLREFVRVFGPYFVVGREAQLALGGKLLSTNNEDDQRDAQTLLMQLWASDDDATVTARAIDLLAQLMTRRGQIEDAVGLYAQLGTRYAGTAVRDGKTGGDIYGELVTDKRLLPFLDPGRVAAMTKYKVETTANQPARSYSQAFALKPEGEFFPSYRRFQLLMELSPNNDNTWILRVQDRNTGEERCKFAGLTQFPLNVNYGGAPNVSTMRLAQANGQFLLLHLGQFAYCFDLAEKREVWRSNLLGKSPPQSTPQLRNEADGEILFQYDDGWTYRLGRSAILQQSYVALVTRDGLKAIDPMTGQDLWVRTNVSNKVQIFGDERHIFLIENGSSKVLRAIDGSAVEGVKDFSQRFAKAGTTTLFGRFILSNEVKEGTRTFRFLDPLSGAEVWSREFPGKPAVLRTFDPEVAGVLKADGEFEAFDVRTGKTLARGKVDEGQVVPDVTDAAGTMVATTPVLLLDAERAYLVLSRARDMSNLNGQFTMGGVATTLRTHAVNGPVYAFDRVTGRRLWYNGDVLLNQQLIVDRFDELPVLVAAVLNYDPQTRVGRYRIVVLDKRTGRLAHNYAYAQNGGEFGSVGRDPKTRAIEFWRSNDPLRLRIVPEN